MIYKLYNSSVDVELDHDEDVIICNIANNKHEIKPVKKQILGGGFPFFIKEDKYDDIPVLNEEIFWNTNNKIGFMLCVQNGMSFYIDNNITINIPKNIGNFNPILSYELEKSILADNILGVFRTMSITVPTYARFYCDDDLILKCLSYMYINNDPLALNPLYVNTYGIPSILLDLNAKYGMVNPTLKKIPIDVYNTILNGNNMQFWKILSDS